jgi:hypothetical protein
LRLSPPRKSLTKTPRGTSTERINGRKQEKEAYEREREQDIEGFWIESAMYIAKLPRKPATKDSDVVRKIKAGRRFHCSPCNRSLASSRALKKHNDSDAHKAQLAIANGATAGKPTKHVLRCRNFNANARAEKRVYCDVCDLAFTGPAKLEIHKKTKGHVKKAAKLVKLAKPSS